MGDVNGDGISDILFGDGVVHLLAGREDWPNYVSAIDAETSYTLYGSKSSSLGGESGTGKAGDVNGDGVDDMHISAAFNYCQYYQCQSPFVGGVVGIVFGHAITNVDTN